MVARLPGLDSRGRNVSQHLWVVTGQVTSAPYLTAIDRRIASRAPPLGGKSSIAAASSACEGKACVVEPFRLSPNGACWR
jgi:hypothetical protein